MAESDQTPEVMTSSAIPADESDVSLIVEGRPIHTHRQILSLASPVFRAMFSHDFKERQETNVDLPNKKYDDVVEFVTWIYPTSSRKLTVETVCRLIHLVDEYQIKWLKEECEKGLIKAIGSKPTDDDDAEFYLECLYIAYCHSLPKLSKSVTQRSGSLHTVSMEEASCYSQLDEHHRFLLMKCRAKYLEGRYLQGFHPSGVRIEFVVPDKKPDVMTSSDIPADDSDVILMVEGRPIHTHRQILSLASPVFRAMFSHDFNARHETNVDLPDKKYEDVVEFLTWIYPTSSRILTVETVCRLIHLVDEYQIEWLEEECEECLIKTIHSHPICGDAEFYIKCLYIADCHSLHKLSSQVIQNSGTLHTQYMEKASCYSKLNERRRFMLMQGRAKFLEKCISSIRFFPVFD